MEMNEKISFARRVRSQVRSIIKSKMNDDVKVQKIAELMEGLMELTAKELRNSQERANVITLGNAIATKEVERVKDFDDLIQKFLNS
jgi:hypothetical protein